MSGDGSYSDSHAPRAAEDDAFIDLNDPNIEILDESNLPAVDADDACESSDDEEAVRSAPVTTHRGIQRNTARHTDEEEHHDSDDDDQETGMTRQDNEEAVDGPQEDDAAEVEDLNRVPDHEPDHDDAVAVFTAKDRQPIHSVAVHPQQPHLIAAAGESEEVYLLRLRPGDSAASSCPLKQERGSAAATALHSAGQTNSHVQATCASGSAENTTLPPCVGVSGPHAACWDVVHTLRAHTDTVSVLSFSPNGSYLASAGLDSVVCIWRVEDGCCLYTLRDLYGEILTLLWHPSSLVLVASADDAQAAMWNVLRGTLVNYFVGHRGAVTTTRWSPDHKRLVTGSADGTVCEYNPRTGAVERAVSKDLSESAAAVTAMCFTTPDSCVVGCEDGTMHVVIFAASESQPTVSSTAGTTTHAGGAMSSGGSSSGSSVARVARHLEELHEQAIETLTVNRNGTLLLSASCDCRVIVWNVADYHPRVVLNVGESVIPAMWLGEYGVVAGCSDGSVRVWDGRDSAQTPRHVFSGHRRMILSLGMAACGGSGDGVGADGERGGATTSMGEGGASSYCIISSSDDGTVRAYPPITI